jgi:hypothetical protein
MTWRRSAADRMRFEFRVAEFDLAVAVQEDAQDVGGVGRDLGCDLVAGPAAGSGEGGDSARRPARVTRPLPPRTGRHREVAGLVTFLASYAASARKAGRTSS